MFLRGIKVGKRVSIQTNLPIQDPMSEEKMAELVAKYRSCEPEQEQELQKQIIMSHMKLAVALVSKYASKAVYDQDSILAAALFGLVVGVKQAKQKLENNEITPYLRTRIESYIAAEFKELKWKNITVRPLENIVVTPFDVINTRETIESICKDKIDTTIIEMSIDGYSVKEISQAVNLSEPTVYKKLSIIRRRYVRSCTTA